jgi:hypothetical protein
MDLARGQDGARVLTRVTLEEAAICMRGANPATRVSGVRSMLRNLFGLNARAEPMPEDEPKPTEPGMPAEEPESEDTVDEAEIEAVVARLTEAVAAGIRGCVSDMAKEKKAAGKKPKPDTTPEEAMPTAGTGIDAEMEDEAARSILAAGYLLADLEIEAALKEGR